MKIVQSVLELIGDTPLLNLSRLTPKGSATLLGKLEAANPGGSVKDRLALTLIESAEREGRLRPGDTIIEASGGNSGIALALVAAVKGYSLIVVMPESVSLEHRKLLLLLGAQVILTPAAGGMAGAVELVKQLARTKGYFHPDPFSNPASIAAHVRTARELLEATEGRIDAFVAGVGTGATVTGVGEVLKRELPGVLVVAVEPAGSPLLSEGRTGPHNIPGLGANFIPPILKRDIIDEVIAIRDEEARDMALELARVEGLLVGVSSGANVAAALKVASRLGPGKTVVTVLPDSGERYTNMALILESLPRGERRR